MEVKISSLSYEHKLWQWLFDNNKMPSQDSEQEFIQAMSDLYNFVE